MIVKFVCFGRLNDIIEHQHSPEVLILEYQNFLKLSLAAVDNLINAQGLPNRRVEGFVKPFRQTTKPFLCLAICTALGTNSSLGYGYRLIDVTAVAQRPPSFSTLTSYASCISGVVDSAAMTTWNFTYFLPNRTADRAALTPRNKAGWCAFWACGLQAETVAFAGDHPVLARGQRTDTGQRKEIGI